MCADNSITATKYCLEIDITVTYTIDEYLVHLCKQNLKKSIMAKAFSVCIYSTKKQRKEKPSVCKRGTAIWEKQNNHNLA